LVQTTFLTTAVLSTVAATLDLSLTQVRVLGILQDRQARMSALAAYLGLDKSTMSGLIDRAVARGLVIRSQDPADRRATLVTVSETGLELARSTRDAVGTALADAIGTLTAAERKSLTQLLFRMNPVADSSLEASTTD
jgi:DNA-binding MarR family transcriptional regulator